MPGKHARQTSNDVAFRVWAFDDRPPRHPSIKPLARLYRTKKTKGPVTPCEGCHGYKDLVHIFSFDSDFSYKVSVALRCDGGVGGGGGGAG